MNEISKNGNVKWVPLMGILITIILSLCGYTFSVSYESIQRDKEVSQNAFRKDEHLQFEKRMDDRFNHIDDKFAGLNFNIRELKIDFREGMKSISQNIKDLKN